MSRSRYLSRYVRVGFPRPRGDEPKVVYALNPLQIVFPARAGMSRTTMLA